ncbi:unnamed protein product, partial [Scytosiphon promiscuus]
APPFTARRKGDVAQFVLRVLLADRPGALAALSESLAAEGVSVDKLLQDSADDTGASPIAIVTHRCERSNMDAALARLEKFAIAVDPPRLIRIESAS